MVIAPHVHNLVESRWHRIFGRKHKFLSHKTMTYDEKNLDLLCPSTIGYEFILNWVR